MMKHIQITMIDLMMIFPFEENFLQVFSISTFPSYLFQPFSCICFVALQLQALDGKNSFSLQIKKDDHAAQG